MISSLDTPNPIINPSSGYILSILLSKIVAQLRTSLYSISGNSGETWSEPKELHAALTGGRHTAHYAPDGRLVVAIRDMAKTSSTFGHYVAWVG